MAKEITFQLHTDAAGSEILQKLARPLIERSGNAILSRAQSMAAGISSDPPDFELSTEVGTIKRGKRAIATIKANPDDAHQSYIGHQALAKAKDAGKVN